MPFATLVLFAWIPITAIIFHRLPANKAVVVTLLWGYLFLPELVGINLPVLPTLDKHVMPSVCALVFYLSAQKREAQAARAAARRAGGARQATRKTVVRQSGKTLITLCAFLLLLSCVVTYLTNQDIAVFGPRVLRAMAPYDMLSMIQNTIFMLIPILLVRHVIVTREMMVFAIKAFVIAALAYSMLILFESRMSPQLHNWIYGFHPHSFLQHIRGGHFRPMVFLGHGLRVGIFMTMAILAAATLFRITTDKRQKTYWALTVLWLVPIIYLSRNTGAFFLTLMLTPLVMFFSARLQLIAASAVCAIVLIYPMARGANLIPIDAIMEQAANVNQTRADSLAFRLHHEDVLLERANLKPLGGWGTWGRNRVYDPETGIDLSVTDGTWVIKIGVTGWLGYIGLFSLLCLPPILLSTRKYKANLSVLESGASLMLAANLIDMIPNSSLVLPAWLIAGVLWARIGWPPPTEQAQETKTRSPSAKRPRPQRSHRGSMTGNTLPPRAT